MIQPPTAEEDRESWANRTDAQRRRILGLEDTQEELEDFQKERALRFDSRGDRTGVQIAYGRPGVSISGWLATLLGIYLIGAGAWSVFEITKSGKINIIDATLWYLVPDKDWPTARPILSLPTNIILITAGSGLLALGSIARSSKRSKISQLPE